MSNTSKHLQWYPFLLPPHGPNRTDMRTQCRAHSTRPHRNFNPVKEDSKRLGIIIILVQAQELSTTRELFVCAETSKTCLEEIVFDFLRRFQGNKEKLAAYKRRGTVAFRSSAVAADRVEHLAQMGDVMTKEQQFEAEVAELRYVSYCLLRSKRSSSLMLVVLGFGCLSLL